MNVTLCHPTALEHLAHFNPGDGDLALDMTFVVSGKRLQHGTTTLPNNGK